MHGWLETQESSSQDIQGNKEEKIDIFKNIMLVYSTSPFRRRLRTPYYFSVHFPRGFTLRGLDLPILPPTLNPTNDGRIHASSAHDQQSKNFGFKKGQVSEHGARYGVQ